MMLRVVFLFAFFLNSYSIEINRVKQLESNAPSILAQYGTSAVMNSDYIVVSAPKDSVSESFAGALYVYSRDSKEYLMTLSPPNESALMQVGTTLAISDTYIIAGVPRYNGNQGVVYVWELSSGLLAYTIAHPSPATDDQFGSALSVNGSTLIVGAKGDENESTGEAERNHGTALEYDLSNEGAYVRTYNAPTLVSEDLFGQAVHVSDAYVSIGASNRAHNGMINAGVVYVYDRSSRTLVYTLHASDYQEGGFFGFSLDSFEEKLLVGTGIPDEEQGAVYVFDLTTGAQVAQVLEPSSGAPGFGKTIAMGDFIFVGAFLNRSGVLYVYDSSGRLLSSISEGVTSGAQFTRALDVHKGGVLIGAPNVKTNNLTSAGAAYLYSITNYGLSVSIQGSDVILNWSTQPNRSYNINYSIDLFNWQPLLVTPFSATSSIGSVTHAQGALPNKVFYRVSEAF